MKSFRQTFSPNHLALWSALWRPKAFNPSHCNQAKCLSLNPIHLCNSASALAWLGLSAFAPATALCLRLTRCMGLKIFVGDEHHGYYKNTPSLVEVTVRFLVNDINSSMGHQKWQPQVFLDIIVNSCLWYNQEFLTLHCYTNSSQWQLFTATSEIRD